MSDIVVNVVLEAREGRAEELEAALRAALPPSRAEDGNIVYELHRDRKNPNKFMFYEVWRDMEAIKTHNATPHYRTLSETVGPLVAAAPSMATYEKVDAG